MHDDCGIVYWDFVVRATCRYGYNASAANAIAINAMPVAIFDSIWRLRYLQ